MFEELADLYQEVILDHCRHPRNYRESGEATCSAEGRNPLCGDQLRLFLVVREGRIEEATFLGSGCCISKASASILTEAVRGCTREEIERLFEKVHSMVTTGKPPEEAGKLAVFAGVHRFPARVKCAILPWHALMAALKGQAEPVTTENDQT